MTNERVLDGESPSKTSDEIPPAPDTRLGDLIAQAALQYSKKDYDAAAETYALATELQAETNGEMAPENANLLYAYGRCLYHVAVRKSDVLGGKVAGETSKQEISEKESAPHQRLNGTSDSPGQEGIISQAITRHNGANDSVKPPDIPNKPFLQFTGDENFDLSDDDDNEQENEQRTSDAVENDEEEEEDDFANAFEVLDMARVLLLQKIESEDGQPGDVAASDRSDGGRRLRERIADVYDLQAEISLEGERFSSAVADLQSSLKWKKDLFPAESSIMAEAHYKLSLALEFASISPHRKENGDPDETKEPVVNKMMRNEAAEEMEAAISSCKTRIEMERSKRGVSQEEGNGCNEHSKHIKDVEEMISEMQQRLIELRKPPISIHAHQQDGGETSPNSFAIVSKSLKAETATERAFRLEEASKSANDLTSLVKKKPVAERTGNVASDNNPLQSTKRKPSLAEMDIASRKRSRAEDN